MDQSSILVLLLPLYGITVMAGLLNISRSDFTKRKILILCSFAVVTVVVNIYVFLNLGWEVYSKFYIFWMQIPVYIGFWILSKYGGLKLLFTILTSITFASLPVQFVVIFHILAGNSVVWMAIGFAISYLIMVILVFGILRPNFIYMLEHEESKSFSKFCLIPLLYYIYCYVGSGYHFLQYTDLSDFLFRCITDFIVFLSYILLVDIFKNTSEKHLLKHEQTMMNIQMESAREQIEFLKNSQEQSSLYRHDMRHHLSLIKGYLTDGAVQKANDYLTQAQMDIDAITPVHYCENDAANLILSYFTVKARDADTTLSLEVCLPQQLSIPETELCALLSNGLENAITAAQQEKNASLRKVSLNCRISENRLLLYIENNYTGNIVLKNGLPQSAHREEHGFGTKSMAAIAAKRNGYCSCEVDGTAFILRIVLPLW